MNRLIIASITLCLAIGVCAPGLHALDGMFLGMGAEANANTREGMAGGGSFTFGIDANRHIAFGLKAIYSNSFDTVSSLEIPAFVRWFPPLQRHGLYVQWELGSSIVFENSKGHWTLLGSLGAGWRYTLGNNWYIEPFVRGGYPFIWGAGITAGLRFPFSSPNRATGE